MNLQAFLPLELWMDLGMLLTVQLAYGSFRPIRILAAAGAMSLCTVIVGIWSPSPAVSALMHLPVLFIAAKLATGEHRPARILEAAVCMFCAGAAGAGFIALGKGNTFISVLPGIALLLFLLRRHRHENYRWNIEIHLEKDGLTASLPALIDTGNRLREHKSGLPVLIAEAGALAQIAQHVQTLPEDQLRMLPYGVLGSSGELGCFRPDKLEILLPGRGRIPAPPCWVAVYQGRIPGSTRALAPPEFTRALETKRNIFKRYFIE